MTKIALSPNPNGTGTLTLAAPDSDNTTTVTLPANTGELLTTNSSIARSSLPSGCVLQVKQTQKINVFETTSNSYVDITGLSVDITPISTNSQILIISTISVGSSVNSDWGGWAFRFLRDSTPLPVGSQTNNFIQGVTGGLFRRTHHSSRSASYQYLDSPVTTSTVTYKPQVAANVYNGGTQVTINGSNSTNTGYSSNGVSTITVMEISG